MTLRELYRSAGTAGAEGDSARELLEQTHWFTINADFDPRTGEALPQSLSSFLARIADRKPPGVIHDRVYRITEFARPAVKRLLRQKNESPQRDHARLHVRAVREIDAGSFIKLSKRPGRNIREKLAGNPYLEAVRRFQSVDLPENRLFKAYVTELAELLEMRQDLLDEPEDELLPLIRSWLMSDESKVIARWENLPPNNTLLSHRDYGLVWKAWRRLQMLDDDIACDLARLPERRDTMNRWIDYGRMFKEGNYLVADMPVLFDYDKFTIRSWSPDLVVQRSAQRIVRSHKKRVIRKAACLDLSEIRPAFADDADGFYVLTETFVWQRWKNEKDTFDITLFDSDAAYLHPDASTIDCSDLFFATDTATDNFERAARAFADRLRETFEDDKLIWLVPDALNDFELEIIRRNLNARFPGAEPLPRSVAAVFEKVDYSRITKDGYPIVVVDTTGGKTCVTKLIARFDASLEKRSPETRGYYWERYPPVILSKLDMGGEDRRYDMRTVSNDRRWRDSAPPEQSQIVDQQRLREDRRIGRFAFCINLSRSPVAGGMRFHAMQAGAGNIPLWRDRIPELSIKGIKDGYLQRFPLVSRGTTVKPIRGQSVQIPIDAKFPLPAGRRFYQFPLFQGESDAELRYSARLDSPAFPLMTDTECKLILTFQYGDDEPYKLLFDPVDGSFPPIRATWQPTIERIVDDAPAPAYPAPLSWNELQRMPKPDSNETSDLLKWFISAIGMDKDPFIRLLERTIGQISSAWRMDKYDMHYTFAHCSEANEDVFIHEGKFVSGFCYSDYNIGDNVSFVLQLQEHFGRGPSGLRVAASDYSEPVPILVDEIRRRLYFPVIQIWRDGRSINDSNCPKEFACEAKKRIAYLSELISMNELSQADRNELLFLLSCLHKDAPDVCVRWITEQVEDGEICHRRAVGYALGDVNLEWQNRILRQLSSSPNSLAIGIFAYAIWRTQYFVERLSKREIELLLPVLLDRIKSIQPQRDEYDGKYHISVKPLELLLGLLRTRASKDPDIRMLLQPHQRITRKFAEQIDRIEKIVSEEQITLFSRVQIDVPKPEGIRTPDLLYALRLYLTGDDGANLIHITRISDSDDN